MSHELSPSLFQGSFAKPETIATLSAEMPVRQLEMELEQQQQLEEEMELSREHEQEQLVEGAAARLRSVATGGAPPPLVSEAPPDTTTAASYLTAPRFRCQAHHIHHHAISTTSRWHRAGREPMGRAAGAAGGGGVVKGRTAAAREPRSGGVADDAAQSGARCRPLHLQLQ